MFWVLLSVPVIRADWYFTSTVVVRIYGFGDFAIFAPDVV